MRTELRPETVNEYAADMLDGAVLPPIVVFHDGCDFWIGDGFHRIEAARKIGRETIVAEIRRGSTRDAILHAVGANAVHGLRRTQADKRRAVEVLLRRIGRDVHDRYADDIEVVESDFNEIAGKLAEIASEFDEWEEQAADLWRGDLPPT